ncbi:unnamed protein product, partial [Cylicocyclus nassatus]
MGSLPVFSRSAASRRHNHLHCGCVALKTKCACSRWRANELRRSLQKQRSTTTLLSLTSADTTKGRSRWPTRDKRFLPASRSQSEDGLVGKWGRCKRSC